MNNLNPEQKEAVLHHGSPLLVLAGAGTGKTKVLTEKIIHLINSYLLGPHQILAVTFTNKAAFEMKRRITNKIGDLANNIWIGTFHSIATKILKRHPEIVGLKPNFTIIDSEECLRLLKQIIVDFNIDNKEFTPKNYQYQIERLKDKGLLPEDLTTNDPFLQKLPKFLQIYQSYQSRLISLNCTDFGDLLLYNLKIFSISPQVLQYYQDKFGQILVDEYQDTNKAQYKWLIFLAGKQQNICAVGDDDQSIYSWRGAEIANILRFEKDFLNTKIIRLEQNYRSTANILKLASGLIKHNKNRHNKTLWNIDGVNGNQGEKIKLFSFTNDRLEALNIAQIIENMNGQQKINLNHIAILVRAGYQTRSFEEIFMANGLPYRIIGGLKFYERKEIKDVIAYLRVTQNHSDDLALERIINLPKRGIGQIGLNSLMKIAKEQNCSLFLAIKKSIFDNLIKGKSRQTINELIINLEKWQSLVNSISLSDLTKVILTESGYIQMWENEKTPDAKNRVENLQEFIGSLIEFKNLAIFLEYVSLVNNDEKIDNEREMVNILTIHGAKGLEFEVVFIPGLEDGILPSNKASLESNGIEEERRLLYVAITRAKKLLYLSFSQNRFTFGQMQSNLPSQFLKEMPEIVFKDNVEAQKSEKNDSKIDLGLRVFHQKFGYGEVLEIDGEKIKIKFEKADIKTVMKGFVE